MIYIGQYTQLFNDYAQSDAFIKFGEKHAPDNEFEGVLVSASTESDPFGTPKEGEAEASRLVLTFKCPDGKERKLSSSSTRLSKAFSKADPEDGDKLRITRIGEGFQTNYSVKVLERKRDKEALDKVLSEPAPDGPLPFD